MARRRQQREPEPHGEPEEARPDPPPQVPWLHTLRARVLYYLTFAAATFALSQVFRAIRVLTGQEPGGEGFLREAVLGTLWLVMLLGCGFVLALYSYEDLRWKGKLARRVELFERILSEDRGAEN